MISTFLLPALLLVAAVTDVRRHKIYNWNTYPGILAGMVLSAAEPRGIGIGASLAGVLVCGGVMLVCFVLFNMGGGDVKLVAMMGAFLGVERGIEAMLWTFVLGGIMGTALLIWRIGLVRIAMQSVRHLRLVFRSKGWVPLTEEEREPLQRWLFLAPSGLAAACLVLANARYRWY